MPKDKLLLSKNCEVIETDADCDTFLPDCED